MGWPDTAEVFCQLGKPAAMRGRLDDRTVFGRNADYLMFFKIRACRQYTNDVLVDSADTQKRPAENSTALV